jgi:basic amino acid/polyamine antiporter, APA family
LDDLLFNALLTSGPNRHVEHRIDGCMTAAPRDVALLRALGVWGLAANIVNITIGGGIFRLPAAAAGALGAAAPLAYVVCAIAMGLIVLCFAEAGSRVSLTGGLYAYVDVAFGPFVGFLSGVMLWAGMTAALSAVASFFADAVTALLPSLAPSLARAAFLVAVVAALAALNVIGVRQANRFNVAMTVAKLLPLLVLIVVGLGAVHGGNLAWSSAPPVRGVARASAVLIFAFLGVESALVPSGEIRDPAHTVPRAIFLAMVAVTVVYLLIQIVAQGILGASLATQANPLAAAADAVMGAPGRDLILIGSALSMFGYVSGMTLAVPRMLFAFGRDGFLPAAIAAVHRRYRTPYVAIVLQAFVVIVLAVSGSFETLAIIANGSILLVYVACCAAVLRLRRADVREGDPPFRAPLGGIVPMLAIAVIGWLLTSLSVAEWRALLIVAVVASLAYAVSIPSRRSARMAAR